MVIEYFSGLSFDRHDPETICTTAIGNTLDSHLMAFAAEEARRNLNIVDMLEYEVYRMYRKGNSL